MIYPLIQRLNSRGLNFDFNPKGITGGDHLLHELTQMVKRQWVGEGICIKIETGCSFTGEMSMPSHFRYD